MPSEKLVRVHNAYLIEGSKRQKMGISGYDDARSRRGRAFQDAIVLGIVLDGVYSFSRLDEIRQVLDFCNQGMDNSLWILELFAPQDSLNLIQDGVRNGNFDQAFDSQGQDFPRLPPEYYSRYKNVGIENELRLGGFLFWHGTS